jgi:hypothetical protein
LLLQHSSEKRREIFKFRLMRSSEQNTGHPAGPNLTANADSGLKIARLAPPAPRREKATTLAVAFSLDPCESAQIRGKALVSSPARTAASAIPATAAGAATAPASPTVTSTTAGASTASAAVSAVRPIAWRTVARDTYVRRAIAIEVRFVVGEIAAAFNHHRSG